MFIEVDISRQTLTLFDPGHRKLSEHRISTAVNGAGELADSECTPRGRHTIRARIGAGCPVNTVFRGRRPTGEIYTPELRRKYPEQDWILTRILWLSGLEPGINRFGKVDTMRRYIYIHGAPDEDRMGEPSSHGCVKMRNAEIVALFNRVPVGTEVVIRDR
ncbi:MAG: L,D-transpeptidase [Gammaproteobacteria bacterium]|nr:L,D-transpeptidase [Gammaproteobacteria bacterium]